MKEVLCMFDQVLGLLSIIISLCAFFLSALSFLQSRASTVKDFFTQGDGMEMKECRKVIYDIYNNYQDESIILNRLIERSDDVARVISFYDFWGLMVKKKYLPLWTFQDSSKYVTINIYNKARPYIAFRKTENEMYASHFEWLIKKLS